MPLKIPPPPLLTSRELQPLNRWLLEIQSILNSQGMIDPGNIEGLAVLTAQVTALSATVAALSTVVAANTTNIAANTTANTANTTAITANSTAITALQARNQIRNGSGVPASGLGNNGDLYLNNTGGAGTRLYGKIGGAWVAIA